MNKKIFSFFSVLVILFALLFVCVGCADNSAEDSDEVTFIDFSRESAASRGIESWNENLYPPESLYWTYKATKIRGNYTTGQTNGEEKAVVKNGPATGLGTVGPFSVGVWKFEVFGYKSCTENADGELVFTGLVYKCADRNHGATGTTPEENLIVTIDKRPDSVTTAQQIIFELAPNRTFWDAEDGVLALSNMYLTVPEGQKLTVKPSTTTLVRVTVTDMTVPTSPAKVAVSTTTVSAETLSGTRFNLSNFLFEDYYSPVAKFDTGIRNLEFKAEYKDVFTSAETAEYPDPVSSGTDTGWAQIGKISTYPIAFTAGVKTTLSGDINDIKVDTDEYAHDDVFTGAVVKILNNTRTAAEGGAAYDLYKSIADAMKYYGDGDHSTTSGSGSAAVSTPNPIIVIHNIDNGGSVALTKDIVVKVTDENNNRHFIENLTVSSTTGKKITFKLADIDRDYVFAAKDNSSTAKIVNLSYGESGKDTFIQTDDGTLDVKAPNDSVYHTGTADSVTVTSVSKVAGKGYFLGTTKEGTSPITSVSTLTLVAGNLDLGSYTAVNTLTVTPTSKDDATVKGRTTTEVGNINTIRDTAYTGDIFKKVILNANGGTGTTPVTKYGIEGMYMEIPNPFTAPTGKALICWNTEAYRSGTDVRDRVCVGSSDTNLYAIWDYPVAKMLNSDGNYAYYGSLSAAVSASDNSHPIILLKDIDGETVTPAVHTVTVEVNGHKISNTVVRETGSTGSANHGLTLIISSDREYHVCEGTVDFDYDNFCTYVKSSGNKFSLYVNNSLGSDLVCEGTVYRLTLVQHCNVDVKADIKQNCYCECADGSVRLFCNNIPNLIVEPGCSVVCENPDMTVSMLQYYNTTGSGSTDLYAGSSWRTASDSVADGIFKRVTLNGNGTAQDQKVYYRYVVEGQRITIPSDKFTSPAPSALTLTKWNTASDVSGDTYPKDASFIVTEPVTLYACWGNAVAAKIKNNLTGKDDVFFDFASAENVYGTGDYTGNKIVLYSDLKDYALKKNVDVNLNGYKIVDLGTTFTHGTCNCFLDDIARNYSFVMNSGAKFSISYEGFNVYINTVSTATEGSGNMSVTCDAAGDNVIHTGNIYHINVNKVMNNVSRSCGYHILCGRVVKLVIGSGSFGYVAIGEGVTIDELAINDFTALANVSWRATSTSTIGNIANFYFNNNFAGDGIVNMTLNGGGKSFTDSSTSKVMQTITGLKVTIPSATSLFGSTVAANFDYWRDYRGRTYSDGAVFSADSGHSLIAVWK